VSAPLRDFKGCLTAEGFRALAQAPPGQAPAELAAHLTGCARCQDRLLAGATTTGAPPPPRERRLPPPPWRLWVVVVAAVLLALSALAIGRWLTVR